MRPLFIAAGPDIVRTDPEKVFQPFENVHIFPLVAQLIDIPVDTWPSINGSKHAIEHLIQTQVGPHSSLNPWVLALTYTFALGLLLI